MLLVVIVGAIVLSKGKEETVATATPTASTSVSSSVSPSVSSTTSPLVSASVSVSVSVPKTVTITYTDAGFSPANITINKGDTVKFVNNSSSDMWPASAMHPTHLAYPEQSSCFAGKFDGCHVTKGNSYSMKFNLVGAWGYHDHLNASKFGKITVQ